MNIHLVLMTPQLMRTFFRSFSYDPDTFEKPSDFKEYRYSSEQADAYFQKHTRPDRLHFAVMRNQEVIGDLYFKNIREDSCTLSIHLINDSVKNQGFGTLAIQQAVSYAFEKRKLSKVYASALIRNKRSRHVLQKAGFQEISIDEPFCNYICTKEHWNLQNQQI